MKLITNHIALFAIVIQLFYNSGYLLDYYVNTEFYKSKCENKALPKLNCNGKCMLSKMIAQANAENSENPAAPVPEISHEFISFSLGYSLDIKAKKTAINHHDLYANLYQFNYHHSLLKPPIS